MNVPRLLRRAAGLGGDRLADLGPAPELHGVGPWLNTPEGAPLTVARLGGRVVLIEFWTFACGNCQRTLPFLREMHARYAPELQIVGVHTPELVFERPFEHVRSAVQEQEIAFPVALDNELRAWRAYDNHYWPTQYLLDARGHLRYSHIGEGAYGQTETGIRALLADASESNPPAARSDVA